jgi:hypothetical protein
MFGDNNGNNQAGGQAPSVPPQDNFMPAPLDNTQDPTNLIKPLQPTPVPPPSSESPLAQPPTPPSDDNLIAIKQQALSSLTPLVSQIDQSPEEKFKTTMMLIQASDNAALIKEAYTAANQITDEKARAQALIDVINEINYFTQNKK